MTVRSRRGFTLIELLVVIAIIAVLSVVVILSLNPAELLRQSRDASRLSDLATINTSLNIFNEDVGTSMGTAKTVYVSLASASSTCGNLSLPTLPSVYTYQCSTSTSTRNVNGNGWIPVNFNLLSSGSPVSSLPVDPINTSSTRLYYSYSGTGTAFEVVSAMESQKYKLGGSSDAVSTDGGTKTSLHEMGNSLSLEPMDYGDSSLVGYWTFEEGTGSVAYDFSGENATGSWSGTMASGGTYYTTGKVGSYAGYFDGSTNYVNAGYAIPGAGGLVYPFVGWPVTITAWIKENSNSASLYSIADVNNAYGMFINSSNLEVYDWGGGTGAHISSASITPGVWAFVACTFQSGTNGTSCYINSALAFSTTTAIGPPGSPLVFGALGASANNDSFNGAIDDVRAYSRVLSAGEIQAIYASGR